MKYAYALLALVAAVTAVPTPNPDAQPEAEASPDGYGKYANYGSYPPPKGGYGKYANYGKYGAAKREAEPEANPDGYGKYADYGMTTPSPSLTTANRLQASTPRQRTAMASMLVTESTVQRTSARPSLRQMLALTAMESTPTTVCLFHVSSEHH